MNRSWLNDNIKPILVLSVTYLAFAYFFLVTLSSPDSTTQSQIIIAIVGALGTGLGYYFGYSQGASKKDDTINTQVTKEANGNT